MLITLDQTVFKDCATKTWGGSEKISFYTRTDGRSSNRVEQDRIVGNLGEVAAWKVFVDAGLSFPQPNLETISGQYGKWADDLVSPFTLYWKDIKISKHISVKSQSFSQAEKYGLSWTFQLPCDQRQMDPILASSAPSIFVGVMVGNADNETNCEVRAFYWPHIKEQLKNPKSFSLIGKKMCIYYDDIKSNEIDLKDVRQYESANSH